MFIVDLLAAAAEAGAAPQNKFGFKEALEQGGFIAYATVVILGIMSFGSFFILITKWIEQNKILGQYKALKANFWRAPTLKEGAAKLDKNSAWRQIVDDGLKAEDQVGKMDPTEAHAGGFTPSAVGLDGGLIVKTVFDGLTQSNSFVADWIDDRIDAPAPVFAADPMNVTLVVEIARPYAANIGRKCTGCGVGIDAFGSPISAQLITPPLSTILGLAPKNAGSHSTRSATWPTAMRPWRSRPKARAGTEVMPARPASSPRSSRKSSRAGST